MQSVHVKPSDPNLTSLGEPTMIPERKRLNPRRRKKAKQRTGHNTQQQKMIPKTIPDPLVNAHNKDKMIVVTKRMDKMPPKPIPETTHNHKMIPKTIPDPLVNVCNKDRMIVVAKWMDKMPPKPIPEPVPNRHVQHVINADHTYTQHIKNSLMKWRTGTRTWMHLIHSKTYSPLEQMKCKY